MGDFSGEKGYTLRKMILIYDTLGLIVSVVWNPPGTWHDSRAASRGGLYLAIDELPEGYAVLADTAFTGGLINRKVLHSLRLGKNIPLGLAEGEVEELERLNIRARQPGEWGNHNFVDCFRQLRQVLTAYDDAFNGNIMELACRLHNYRVHTCSRNQIQTFFNNLETKEYELEVAGNAEVEDGDEDEDGDE
jgi:hypothetical protein